MNMCINHACKNRTVFAKMGECDSCGKGTLFAILLQFTSNSQALLTERSFLDKKVCIYCAFGEVLNYPLRDGVSNECFVCGHSKQFTSNSSAISQSFFFSLVLPG